LHYTKLSYISYIIDNQTSYLVFCYEILFAVNTIIAYILNYLINNIYIYDNIDFIKNNNNPFLNNTLFFDITQEHNIPDIDNSKIYGFFNILYHLYIFRLFGNLDIELYDLNNHIDEYNKLFKFIILTSLFFNYNTSSSTDKLYYYKNNINLIIERINSSLRSSLRTIPRIGGKKNK